MGVWIETHDWQDGALISKSHTLYGCVDWNSSLAPPHNSISVTPCMGVWIETSGRWHQRSARLVTPCMGVWIETCPKSRLLPLLPVTPCMGVWIETGDGQANYKASPSHTLYGCVDWNLCLCSSLSWFQSHTLYGCVDWNFCLWLIF